MSPIPILHARFPMSIDVVNHIGQGKIEEEMISTVMLYNLDLGAAILVATGNS